MNDIIDPKPKVDLIDPKPKIDSGIIGKTDRLYQVTVNAGQSMGLLLALTYKEGFTVTSSKAP